VPYDDVRVHRDCRIRVAADTGEREVKLFGSVAEIRGHFKVIGIITD